MRRPRTCCSMWIHAMEGAWAKALHYLPSLIGVRDRRDHGLLAASRRGRHVRRRSAFWSKSLFSFWSAILHNRLPGVAGTLGISFVAAMQAASFPRVEAWSYSSVMATTNLRQTIEGLFDAVAGCADPRRFRRPRVFATILVAFGAGAAMGAYVTVQIPALTLGIPVTVLLIALLRCEQRGGPVPTQRTTGRRVA